MPKDFNFRTVKVDHTKEIESKIREDEQAAPWLAAECTEPRTLAHTKPRNGPAMSTVLRALRFLRFGCLCGRLARADQCADLRRTRPRDARRGPSYTGHQAVGAIDVSLPQVLPEERWPFTKCGRRKVTPSPIPVEVLGAPDQTYSIKTTHAAELRERAWQTSRGA